MTPQWARHERCGFVRMWTTPPRLTIGLGLDLVLALILAGAMSPVLVEAQTEFEAGADVESAMGEAFPGVTRASEDITLSAAEAGQIESLNTVEGARVEPGQLLVQLNADRERALVELAELRAGETAIIELAEVQLEAEAAKLERIRTGASGGSVTDWELEEAERAHAAAGLRVREAQERAAAYAAEAAVASINLGRRAIVAPTQGEIIELMVQPGEWIRAGDPIVRMINREELRVTIYLPQALRDRCVVGGTVRLLPEDAAANRNEAVVGGNPSASVATAAIVFVSPELDAVSGAFRCDVLADNAGLNWPSGLNVFVVIE